MTGTVLLTAIIPVSVFISVVTFTGTGYLHLWHSTLARMLPIAVVRRGADLMSPGQTGAEPEPYREMKYIPVEIQYPFIGAICPSCGCDITCGFLERHLCEARFFYVSTGPPRINVRSEPDSRKRVGEARVAFYGTSKQLPLACA